MVKITAWALLKEMINNNNLIPLPHIYHQIPASRKTVDQYLDHLMLVGFINWENHRGYTDWIGIMVKRLWKVPEDLTIQKCRDLRWLGPKACWIIYPEGREDNQQKRVGR
jgi:hypothetical protein